MAFTYTYAVERLKVKDEVNNDGVTLRNAVCNTYWTITGEDEDGNVATWSGATPFSAAAVGEDDFTDFNSLTESTVIGWIRNVVENDAGYLSHINEQLQKQIDLELEDEVSSDSLPWASSNTTPAPSTANTETT